MDSSYFKRPTRAKKMARPPMEEEANRDGHWTREFTSRLEAWPLVEPWVAENNYHMIAAKGRRRLYLKEHGPFYRTIIDIKQHESQMTVSAWIEVKFITRLLSLFFIPSEMFPTPSGVLGVKRRRETCRELNGLLERFRQAPILGSDSFHFFDLDITTLSLFFFFLLPFVLFLVGTFAKFEVVPGLSNALLANMAKYWSGIMTTAVTILAVHHFLFVKKFNEQPVFRLASSITFALGFLIFTIVLLTRTSSEMLEARFVHHCVTHFNPNRCQEMLSMLPERSRDALGQRLKRLDKELSKKD